MKRYIGTKVINATPMTRLAYNQFRGWALPAKENGEDAGYLVEYTDGGQANTSQFDGYVSWSPKEQLEGAYRETGGLTFGLAVEALKKGQKLARSGWNGKGMFVFLVNGSTFNVSRAPLLGIFPEGAAINYRPHIDIKGVDGSISTWVPSIGDVMAEDWAIVESGQQVAGLQPHQQRVVDEKADLDEKLAKLMGFYSMPVFHGLPESEQSRLLSQGVAMRTYSEILASRIAAF